MEIWQYLCMEKENPRKENDMTLKEKVKEVEPDKLVATCPGGVMACPFDYSYLHQAECSGTMTCNECWSQEYVEIKKAQPTANR